MRTTALDTAFLFLLASSGLIFSSLNVTIGGKNGFVLYVPFLFSGFLFPFYIGFLRGVVEFDSDIERIRGWIYLLVGSFLYLFNLSFIMIRDYLQINDTIRILMLVIYIVGWYLFPKRVIPWLVRVTQLHPSQTDVSRFRNTQLAAFFLSGLVFLFEETIRGRTLAITHLASDPVAFLTFALSIVMCLALFPLFEMKARR